MTPLVTVYITSFNYERFIRESIESVLNQTFQNFELIIIDDGSTDNSLEVIEEYRLHDKVRIIHQTNKGLNITNNIAMRAAQGKYIIRLDADDFLREDALQVMSSKLESNDELGLIFPDYFYVDEAGEIIGEERRHNFEEVSLYDQPAHGACTMIRLSFLKRSGGYNESFTCQDGYDLWIKFISHYKVTNINEPLFYYRQHGDSLSSNEDRILSTRKKIKDVFVGQHLTTPVTTAVIPVRNTLIGDVNWPLFEVNGKTVLEHKVDTCLRSTKLSAVVVSVAEEDLYQKVVDKISFSDRLTIIKRPSEFAEKDQSLFKTIQQCLEHVSSTGLSTEAIMSVSLEHPFLDVDMIDDVINTISIFNSDSVITVRPDNNMYYQHTGHTLKPISNQDKFIKLEREAIYKSAGGVVLSTIKNFEKNERLISGKTSHVIVDQRTGFKVESSFELDLFKAQVSQRSLLSDS
ncbi:MAG: glycosyltransferase [Bacteroidota bacterium]